MPMMGCRRQSAQSGARLERARIVAQRQMLSVAVDGGGG
jgi:hypothetical protein